MDVRELQFGSESFDVAIDKGTMDAMMTAKADVWASHYSLSHPPPDADDKHRTHQKKSSRTACAKSAKSSGTTPSNSCCSHLLTGPAGC